MRKRHCPPDDDYTHGGSLDGSNRGRSVHTSLSNVAAAFFSFPPTFLHYCLLVCNTAYVIKLFILGVVESKRWKDNDSTSFSLCRNTTHRGIASFCFSVFHLSCLKRFTKKKKRTLIQVSRKRTCSLYIDACWLSLAVSFFWLLWRRWKMQSFFNETIIDLLETLLLGYYNTADRISVSRFTLIYN